MPPALENSEMNPGYIISLSPRSFIHGVYTLGLPTAYLRRTEFGLDNNMDRTLPEK